MYILDDAAIAAAAEAAKVAAAEAAAQAAAQAAAAAATETAAAGATELAAPAIAESTAPLAAQGAEVTPALQNMHMSQAMAPLNSQSTPPPEIDPNTIESGFGDPSASLKNISEGNLTKELTAPALEYSQSVPGFTDSIENIGRGDVNAELKNLGKSPDMPGMGGNGMNNPLAMFGGSDEPPMPAPQPLQPAPQVPPAPATPSTPGTPMSMTDKMRGAHAALRLASKLTTNKKDKQMLGLLSMTTAMGSTGGDLSDPKSIEMLNGPLEDISSSVEAPKPKPMSPLAAPSVSAPTPGGQVGEAPATMRGTGALPATRLTPGMSPDERLRRLYGGM